MNENSTASRRRRSWRSLCLVAILATSVASVGRAVAQELPRFVSLAADPIEARSGPPPTRPIAVIWRRAGWPVEVVSRSQNWLEVRDWEGTRVGCVPGSSRVDAPPSSSKAHAHASIRESERRNSDVLASWNRVSCSRMLSCNGHDVHFRDGATANRSRSDLGHGPGEIVKHDPVVAP